MYSFDSESLRYTERVLLRSFSVYDSGLDPEREGQVRGGFVPGDSVQTGQLYIVQINLGP